MIVVPGHYRLTYKLGHQVTVGVHGARDVLVLNQWEEELHELHGVRRRHDFQHLQDGVHEYLFTETTR